MGISIKGRTVCKGCKLILKGTTGALPVVKTEVRYIEVTVKAASATSAEVIAICTNLLLSDGTDAVWDDAGRHIGDAGWCDTFRYNPRESMNIVGVLY